MTLIQLSYIVAVDTYRHFGKAAEKCFVSQPTLSMQIQKLEETMNVIIFDRSKQPIVPTDLGKKIVDQARIVLKESQRIQDVLDIDSGEISGEFRIGIIPTLSPYLVPLFLSNFVNKYPKVDLSLHEIQTDQIIQKIRNDSIDIGILATPLNETGIFEQHLFYEDFFAFLPPEHRLKDKTEVKTTDLILDDILLLDEGNCFREQTIQLCKKFRRQGNTKSKTKTHFESGNLETLKKLVKQNFGMTLLPQLMVNEFKDDEKQYLRQFVEPIPKREISIVYGRSYLKKHIIDSITKVIKKSVPKKMTEKKSDSFVVDIYPKS